MRLTKHRKNILTVLESTHGTLSANDIHALLPNIDLVTIYRSLDLFVSEGIIKKLHLDKSEASYEFQNHPHHHAICTDCDKVIHFEAQSTELKKLFQLKGFTISDIDITVRGTCDHTKKHST